jgi:hypothetical protein
MYIYLHICTICTPINVFVQRISILVSAVSLYILPITPRSYLYRTHAFQNVFRPQQTWSASTSKNNFKKHESVRSSSTGKLSERDISSHRKSKTEVDDLYHVGIRHRQQQHSSVPACSTSEKHTQKQKHNCCQYMYTFHWTQWDTLVVTGYLALNSRQKIGCNVMTTSAITKFNVEFLQC